MAIGRRVLLKLLGGGILFFSSAGVLFRRVAPSEAQSGFGLRKVLLDDAPQLEAIMNACVSDADAFHGKCNPWSLRWASLLVRRRPETLVITLDGTPVAFTEVPSIQAPSEAPGEGASDADWERYELRERSRKTFYLSAVGVDAGALSPAEAVQTFRRALYYGLKRARTIGFEQFECIVPWVHHPRMPRAWTDYPGCELIAHSRNQEDGNDAYWLRCHLDEAIQALAQERAADEALDGN